MPKSRGCPREDATSTSAAWPRKEKIKVLVAGQGESWGGRTMIGYIDIAEQVDADFTRALRRAFFYRVVARLRGDPSRAPSFEEASRASGARNMLRLGRRVVAVDKIVGSVGRSRDFDGGFLPIRRSLGERWKRVDRAFHRGTELPPVVLYELGNRYYVQDGNHRVSVARYQGVRWIEAEVTRLHAGTAGAPSDPSDIAQSPKGPEEASPPIAA
jgi:hypothetical protein